MKRISILSLISFLMVFAVMSCTQPSQDPDDEVDGQKSAANDDDEVLIESQLFEAEGIDPDEMLFQWGQLGENSDILRSEIQTDEEGLLLEIFRWRIAEIVDDYEEPYKLELPDGDYSIHGFGGQNLERLTMSIGTQDNVTLEMNYLDSSLDEGVTPLLEFTLEEPQEVMVEVNPTQFRGNTERAFYCWMIYQTPLE